MPSPEIDFRFTPNSGHSSPTSVSDQGLEANSCWKFSEPIIARGYFVGLFLQGVARQANATGAVMMGELDGRVSAWKRTPESFGVESPICRGDGGLGR